VHVAWPGPNYPPGHAPTIIQKPTRMHRHPSHPDHFTTLATPISNSNRYSHLPPSFRVITPDIHHHTQPCGKHHDLFVRPPKLAAAKPDPTSQNTSKHILNAQVSIRSPCCSFTFPFAPVPILSEFSIQNKRQKDSLVYGKEKKK